MKIAIAAPSPVPFTIGGAENFWWGLVKAINDHTSHQAELIKLPCPEDDFWSIIKSYEQFSRLDLSHFDMVISTKNPAWMIEHPNHICYMQHRLRGFYDFYPPDMPLHCRTDFQPAASILEYMVLNRESRRALSEFFDRLQGLKNNPDLPGDIVQMPGPFSRSAIHFLDSIGLSPKKIVSFAAISKTIALRKDYFPQHIKAEVIHHPSTLPEFHNGKYDYLFTASRLSPPKRIGLFIEAMKLVQSPVKLLIAGTGPQESYLKDLAKNDPRIKFLGFVKDSELIDYYADALCVLFAPYDEDYG
ncbi:MAG: glycosyltransferase, partial [Pseudomonadota bacterium]